MQIHAYNPVDKKEWDNFVAKSKNGTFLFLRDYMDYHADRFTDCSLIVTNDKGRIISLLPANIKENVLISHEGLTYGGFITDDKMTTPLMLDVFDQVIDYLRERGITKFVYKTIPRIYHSLPAEEDLYCLFRQNATLYRRDVLAVIDYTNKLKLQRRRVQSIRKALSCQTKVMETDDYEQFWDILSSNLYTRYGCKPVHSIEEITLLAHRFSDNIRLVAAYCGNVMQAGVVVYLSQNVCHCQYSAANEEGKKIAALDLVFDYVIEAYRGSRKFFDFGISNEDNGRYLNVGLMEYKEGFGARVMAHDFYELTFAENISG